MTLLSLMDLIDGQYVNVINGSYHTIHIAKGDYGIKYRKQLIRNITHYNNQCHIFAATDGECIATVQYDQPVFELYVLVPVEGQN